MHALDPVVSWIVALGAAVLFGSSAVHKLRDWSRFTGALADYRVLPARMLPLAAPVIAGLEVAAAVLILPPATRAAGAWLAAALLACYAGAIAVNLHRGRTSIDCGCLGVSQRRRIGPGMVVRNVALCALVLLAAWPQAGRGLVALDVLTIAATSGVCALLYLAIETLASNALAARGVR
jgi:hypothetical protein